MPKKKTALTIEERLQQALVPAEEQPYEVPENWVWVRLGSLYEVNPKNKADDESDAAFIPMEKISAGMLSEYSYETQKWCKAKKGHTQFADGDVAFAKISPCFENRKSMMLNNLPNSIGGGTTELIILRNASINQKYTFWLVSDERFIRGGVQTYSGTVGQQRINMDYVRSYPIPLPPLSEQQRIVDRIEELFAKLDEAKERLQEVVDSFAVRKAAILHKAFTGELTKQWRRENGVTDESWEEKKLGEVGSWLGGGTPSTSREEYWDNGNILWITSKDMKSAVIEDTLMKVNEIGVKNSSANYIEKPAILVVMRSGILRRTFPVAMVKKPFTVNQDLKAIVPDKDDLEFLFWMLLSNERLILDSCMKNGTTVESINSNALKAFAFKCPTLPEQHEIVRLIDDLLARERSAQQAAEQALASIDLMKKSILARAFRGELGTNKASEASAVELLKQLLAEN